MLNPSNSKVIIRRVTESGGWWLTNFRFCVRRNGSGFGSDQPTSDFRLYVRRNGSGGGWWSANKWYPSLRAQKRKRSVPNLPKTSERGIASRYQPCLVSVNSTDRFHFAVLLFSNRSQMTSKSAKKKNVAQEAQPNASLMFSPYFDVFCDLLLHVQTHGNKESTYFIWGETKNW